MVRSFFSTAKSFGPLLVMVWKALEILLVCCRKASRHSMFYMLATYKLYLSSLESLAPCQTINILAIPGRRNARGAKASRIDILHLKLRRSLRDGSFEVWSPLRQDATVTNVS